MNQETVEYLQRAAENGVYETCSIRLNVDSLRPEAESEVIIAWEITQLIPGDGQAERGILRISSVNHNENIAVAPAGNINLRVGEHPVIVELRVREESKRLTIRPRLLIPEITLMPPDRVRLDEETAIDWSVRNGVHCHILVRNGDELLCNREVPANGRLNFVARNLQPVTIHMQARSRHAHLSDSAIRGQEIALEPEVAVPDIRFNPAERLVVGEDGEIAWNISQAESCYLEVSNGEQILFQGEVPAAGHLKIAPRELRPVDLRMWAMGRHAHLSDKARSSLTTSLTVFAPPVRICVDGGETRTGFMGDEVTFNWRITGAKEIFLKAEDRGEMHQVPFSAGIAVEVVMEEEIFNLVAVGLDGAEHVKRLKVVPRFADLLFMPEEYQLLHSASWEG